jgi:hypothetical protein
LAGAVLALIATVKKRWWLLLAAAWIATFAFLCWDIYKYPPII